MMFVVVCQIEPQLPRSTERLVGSVVEEDAYFGNLTNATLLRLHLRNGLTH